MSGAVRRFGIQGGLRLGATCERGDTDLSKHKYDHEDLKGGHLESETLKSQNDKVTGMWNK